MSVIAHRSSSRYQSALLRARRETSRPSIDAHVAECHFGGHAREAAALVALEPDRPRSSSMTVTRAVASPARQRVAASAYWRSVDSRLCSTCAADDWRT